MRKLTFKMETPIILSGFRPTLDAVLQGAFGRMKDAGCLNEFESIGKGQYLYRDNYYKVPFASLMFYDEAVVIENEEFWVKRWDEQFEFLSEQNKVNRSSGQFKDYKVPLSEVIVPEVWFYLETGCEDKIKYLIDNFLPGIGKKVSQGYGQFSDCKITKINHDDLNFQDYCLRPYPNYLVKVEYKNKTIERYHAWKAPYGHPESFELCLMPLGEY